MKAFLTIIILGTILFLNTSCENDMAEIQRFIAKEDLKMERATGVTILYSDSGLVTIRIMADTLLSYTDLVEPKKVFPAGLTVDFLNGTEEVQSKLKADYAIQYSKENKLVALGNVVVKGYDNQVLTTEELVWDDNLGEVYSEKFVKVTTLDEVIYGFGFRSDQEFNNWEIKKVQGRLSAEDIRGTF